VAPRLFARLDDEKNPWGDARLPIEGRYLNVLTGETVHGGRLAEMLASFPVALLVREG
jgi:maltooligosyltrehalose synthase